MCGDIPTNVVDLSSTGLHAQIAYADVHHLARSDPA